MQPLSASDLQATTSCDVFNKNTIKFLTVLVAHLDKSQTRLVEVNIEDKLLPALKGCALIQAVFDSLVEG